MSSTHVPTCGKTSLTILPHWPYGLNFHFCLMFRSLFFFPSFFFFKQKTAYEFGLGIPAEPLFRSFPLSAADLPPSPTKSSNLSETAEVPACNVPSRSPLPALAIAPETKLGTASSGLGTLEP